MLEKEQENCFPRVIPEHMFFWKWSFASNEQAKQRYLGKKTLYIAKVSEEDTRFPM